MHFAYWTGQTMYVQRNIEAPSCQQCCSGKAISITYSKWGLVALGIQNAMRMRHIVICGLPGSRLYHIFPHYLTNGTTFETKLLNTKCVFWFSLQISSESSLILRKKKWARWINNVYWYACKVLVIFIRFEWNLKFHDRFSKKTSNIKISWKPVQWETSCWMRSDGQT